MTKEELQAKEAELDKVYKNKLHAARMSYALTNARYRKGDVISGPGGRIIIESISYRHIGKITPEILYRGSKVTTKGELYKDASKGAILESQIFY